MQFLRPLWYARARSKQHSFTATRIDYKRRGTETDLQTELIINRVVHGYFFRGY